MSFLAGDSGVMESSGAGQPDVVICSPLYVDACTHDKAGTKWGRLLRWTDLKGGVHEQAVPMHLLAAQGKPVISYLLDRGLTIQPYKQDKVLEYIQSEKPDSFVLCTDMTGWHDQAFVLPGTVIQDDGNEPIVYQPAQSWQHRYAVSGSLAEWRDHVASLCSGNSRLQLAVSCAFAGPLLRLVGEESGGIHLYGGTSCGKTTGAIVADSIFGGGGKDGFATSWRATANGLELISAQHNDTCLVLDELSQVNPSELSEVVYMLANGQGKTRATNEIALRNRNAWSLSLISTGELSMEQHANAGANKLRGGVGIRILDIPADAGAGMGAFENLHGAVGPADFAKQLRNASLTHYGSPLHALLEHVVTDPIGVVAIARRVIQDFRRRVLPTGASAEVGRGVDRFAVIAAAGELATQLGITGWNDGEATWACEKCFTAWLNQRGGNGSFDDDKIVSQITHFLQVNGESRFSELGAEGTPAAGFVYRERAGYRRTPDYLFETEVFRREVCRGYDYRRACEVLKRRGLLNFDVNRLEKQVRISGKQRRFYAVRMEILNE